MYQLPDNSQQLMVMLGSIRQKLNTVDAIDQWNAKLPSATKMGWTLHFLAMGDRFGHIFNYGTDEEKQVKLQEHRDHLLRCAQAEIEQVCLLTKVEYTPKVIVPPGDVSNIAGNIRYAISEIGELIGYLSPDEFSNNTWELVLNRYYSDVDGSVTVSDEEAMAILSTKYKNALWGFNNSVKQLSVASLLPIDSALDPNLDPSPNINLTPEKGSTDA